MCEHKNQSMCFYKSEDSLNYKWTCSDCNMVIDDEPINKATREQLTAIQGIRAIEHMKSLRENVPLTFEDLIPHVDSESW